MTENRLLKSERRKILDRDGHICQDCGVFVGAMTSDLPTGHVHHIDGDQTNNASENLVTLCRDCNNERHDHYIPEGADDTDKYGHPREEHYRWKGGRYTAPNGYIYVLRPGHPNADNRGYVAEHRLIAANDIGRALERNEVVHHRNGDRSDNRLENLEVLTIAEHMERHRGEDSDLRAPGESNPSIECACGCGETLKKYDENNRPREYIHGHNSREQAAPTQERIVAILADDGPMKRAELIDRMDTTESGVGSALRELKDKSEVEPGEERGEWKFTGDSEDIQSHD